MTSEKSRGNCPFSPGLNCETLPRPCTTCGWNPEVAERRLKELKAVKRLRATWRENQ